MSRAPSSCAKAMSKKKRQPVVVARPKEFCSAIKPEEYVRSLGHMNHKQARRLVGPIYKVLSQELYEEGCTMAGDFFNCLVLKERRLFGLGLTRAHVKDYPELLLKLHENVKLAEQAAKLQHCGGMLACLKILYQTLKLLEGQHRELEWLLKDLNTLFVDIAEKYAKNEPSCDEIKAHLFCNHAMLWAKEPEQFHKCVLYFNKSLEMCRGAKWPAADHKDSRHYETFHEFVAINFASILIKYAITLLYSNPDQGMELVLKAIIAISEVDHPSNRSIQNQVLLCEALVLKIRLLIELKKYEEAIVHIGLTNQRVDTNMGDDFMRFNCELSLLKGVCFLHLEEFDNALLRFKKSLLISQRNDLPLLRGQALVHIGELYAKHPGGKLKAIKAFEESKFVFNQLHDASQKRRAVYGLARLLAQDLFPHILKLMKSSNQFCALYALRKWKYLHVSPWEMIKSESVDLHATSFSHLSKVDLSEQYKSVRSSEITLGLQLYNENSFNFEDWSGIESDSRSDPIDMDCLLNEN